METTKVEFRLTASTDVGFSRPHNEDNFTVNADLTKKEWLIPEQSEKPLVLGKYGCCFVVADGMGGTNAGEVASAIAVSQVAKIFGDVDLSTIVKDDHTIEKFLCNLIKDTDKAIRKHAKDVPASKGMGTTIILVWVLGCRAHLAWCGDSRAYIFNKTNGLCRFSKDHSYVQELVDKGILDESLAFDHPDSNIITRCLGDFPAEVKPEYKSYYLQKDDFILLCSDGLCGYCRDEEIENVMLQTCDDIVNCNQKLIEAALNAGGYDNITTALFQLVSVSNVNVIDSADVSSAVNEGTEEQVEDIEKDTLQFKPKPQKKESSKLTVFLVVVLIILAVLFGLIKFGMIHL